MEISKFIYRYKSSSCNSITHGRTDYTIFIFLELLHVIIKLIYEKSYVGCRLDCQCAVGTHCHSENTPKKMLGLLFLLLTLVDHQLDKLLN